MGEVFRVKSFEHFEEGGGERRGEHGFMDCVINELKLEKTRNFLIRTLSN
jgi:hypothetical protein